MLKEHLTLNSLPSSATLLEIPVSDGVVEGRYARVCGIDEFEKEFSVKVEGEVEP